MNTVIPTTPTQTIFDTARHIYSYESFSDLLTQLLGEGKTTGENHSAEYLHYAKLNLQRMRRWDKTFELRADVLETIKTLPAQNWWVITEGWCGDSAQNLPALQKMAAASEGKINLHIILRDENQDIMSHYLTNGTSRSIPILVAFDKEGHPLFRWGPRPAPAQHLLNTWKANPVPMPFEDFELEMHTWYTKDKGSALQDEILHLLHN
jgi:hypothetical protein